MKNNIKIYDTDGIKSLCIPHSDVSKICYLIYPAIVPFRKEWLEKMSSKYGIPIVVIYIPADGWNDMLTPWPEPGETPDSPPFAGKAAETLQIIKEKIIPATDSILGIKDAKERNLIGVSLSGLFTLWQWLQCDLFTSIGCLSGSFWYNGFIEWFEKQQIPAKSGKAYFLLGVKEPKAWIKAYRTVGVNTEKVVQRLQESKIPTTFQWVPGDHFADPEGRAEDGIKALFS